MSPGLWMAFPAHVDPLIELPLVERETPSSPESGALLMLQVEAATVFVWLPSSPSYIVGVL